MFLGEFRQVIDEKGGLLLPSQYLSALGAGMVVTRGFDRNLMLFPRNEWQILASKILNRPLSIQQSRNLRRRLFSSAALIDSAKNSHIQIPQTLREFAELSGEVILTGMYDYLEIWNMQFWRSECEVINESANGSIWETTGV